MNGDHAAKPEGAKPVQPNEVAEGQRVWVHRYSRWMAGTVESVEQRKIPTPGQPDQPRMLVRTQILLDNPPGETLSGIVIGMILGHPLPDIECPHTLASQHPGKPKGAPRLARH